MGTLMSILLIVGLVIIEFTLSIAIFIIALTLVDDDAYNDIMHSIHSVRSLCQEDSHNRPRQ